MRGSSASSIHLALAHQAHREVDVDKYLADRLVMACQWSEGNRYGKGLFTYKGQNRLRLHSFG